MGVFDWKHWLVILIVVVLVFGTKKLKNVGSDLGSAIKGFRKAMNEEDEQVPQQKPPLDAPKTSQSDQSVQAEEPSRKA